MHKPLKLTPNDTVRIIAPASPFERPAFEEGVGYLKDRGLKVQYRPDIFDKEEHLAGSDQRRLQELLEALADPACRAIFCARGGYGSSRLLPQLSKQWPKRQTAKIFVGYSDLTALLSFLVFERKQTAIHGPLIAGQLSRQLPEESAALLWKMLYETAPLTLKLTGEWLATGSATQVEGQLFGGNLSLFDSLIGLPWQPKLKGRILFIEEVSERPYRIDRLFTHLTQVGFWQGLQGVIVGPLGSGDVAWEKKLLLETFTPLKIPLLYGCGIGHHAPYLPLPVGVGAKLHIKKQELWVESPVTE